MEKKQRKSLSSGGHAHRELYLCKGNYPRPPWNRDQAEGAGSHSPSGLRQKSVEAEPCSLWMVHRYTPQSTGDACTMARAAGPSSPALLRPGLASAFHLGYSIDCWRLRRLLRLWLVRTFRSLTGGAGGILPDRITSFPLGHLCLFYPEALAMLFPLLEHSASLSPACPLANCD